MSGEPMRLEPEQAVALLRKYFFNRLDIAAFLPPWKKPCPLQIHDNLDALLYAHILGPKAPAAVATYRNRRGAGTAAGHFRIGAYTPAPGGKTKWVCIDLDGGADHASALADPDGAARQVLSLFGAKEVPVYLERSGGGKGWHVWCFFEEPVYAVRARRLALSCIPPGLRLGDGLVAEPEKNRGVEIFPKQNDIAKGKGAGNMVWLPWWWEAPQGCNRFYRVGDGGAFEPLLLSDFKALDSQSAARVIPAEEERPAAPQKSMPPGNLSLTGNPSPVADGNDAWKQWRKQALAVIDIPWVYGDSLTGRHSGDGWFECRDLTSKNGDRNPSAGVADGTGIAERAAFHSFISGENWSAFDELVRQGRAQNFAEATRMVAERTGIPLPLPALGSPGGGAPSPSDPSGIESRKLTDLGNAMLFKSQHDEGVFFDPAADWRVWDGRRWKLDSDGEIERRAYRTARSLYREASQTSDPEMSQAIARWAMKSQARERLSAITAVSRPLMAIDPARLDAEPWVLNVQNGMIDLATGSLIPHDRRRLCTRVCPVEYDAQARSDLFERVLADALPDESVRTYFQKVCGLTLIGEQVEDVIIFAHGPEATAKTTLIEPLKKLFGDYAVTVEPETLMSTRNGGGGQARGDIARLAGTRLAITTETEDGTRFAVSLLKRLSGNDTITARHIYKKDFEFRPSCTIWIVSNHRPKADAMDGGLWRRLKVIPFIRQIPKGGATRSSKKGCSGRSACERCWPGLSPAACSISARVW